MASAPITRFEPDEDRLAVIRECMEHYDVGDRAAEWPNNLLSRRAIVYASGLIARQGDQVCHAVDPDELGLCRRLACEIEGMMAGVSVGMGSESGDEFRGFFIAGTVGELVPRGIDEALIRSRFGGTIFPPATISVEPLAEGTGWWGEVEEDGSESAAEYFAPWRSMIQWFCGRIEFVSTAFVRIGNQGLLWELPPDEWPAGTASIGCVYPRMALALTRGGSLVGLFGWSVLT